MQPHIRCSMGDLSPYCLIVGDPARVDRVASFLSQPRHLAYNREFKSLKGSYKGLEITVLSTGIGGPSTVIAIEEMARLGVKNIIRLGSCGANQPDLAIGDLVIAKAAVREDGAGRMYLEDNFPAVASFELTMELIGAAKELGLDYQLGLVRSHDSFYIDHEAQLMDYYSSKGVLASDMETASLFLLGSLRGIRTASILNNLVVYGRDLGQSISSYVNKEEASMAGEERQIRLGLEGLYRISRL